MPLLLSADFIQSQLFRKILSGTLSECHSVWIHFVGPDQGPNCLQRLSTEDKVRR